MKKVILTAAIIASLGLVSVTSSQAQMPVSTEQTADAFVKIETAALPEAVTTVAAKEYEGSKIKEAFEDKDAKLFKVVLTLASNEEKTVIFNEKGEAQKDQVAPVAEQPAAAAATEEVAK